VQNVNPTKKPGKESRAERVYMSHINLTRKEETMEQRQADIIETAIRDGLKAVNPTGESGCQALLVGWTIEWIMNNRYAAFSEDIRQVLIRKGLEGVMWEQSPSEREI
jgi:hypothetical protein